MQLVCRRIILSQSSLIIPLEAALLNARSLRNKTIAISDYIVDNSLDIGGITETWLRAGSDAITIGEITPPGYSLVHIPRPSGGKGGGVGLLYQDSFKLRKDATRIFSSFEHMMVTLSIKSRIFRVVVVYRPPTSQKKG